MYIFISKRANNFSKFIVNLILENFTEIKIHSNVLQIDKSDIVIGHFNDRTPYKNKNGYNILISGESYNKGGFRDYDLSITTINDFQSKVNIYYPHLYASLHEHSLSVNPSDYINTKKYFCAYMYSHDVEHRVKYFNLFNDVHALGKSQNNIQKIDDRYNDNYLDQAVKIYTDYKFVLALENKYKEYYFTEKLINPIIANSIPIYWGHPSIFEFINKKRVIYIQDFESDEDLVNYVMNLTDEEYYEIINEPIYLKTPHEIDENLRLSIQKILSNINV